jgi:hypothetical protein
MARPTTWGSDLLRQSPLRARELAAEANRQRLVDGLDPIEAREKERTTAKRAAAQAVCWVSIAHRCATAGDVKATPSRGCAFGTTGTSATGMADNFLLIASPSPSTRKRHHICAHG